jgi:membrane dipeptidase
MPLDLPIVNPLGIRSATEFPNLTTGLLERGYAEGDVRKIMGENWLRLYRKVWR